MSGSWLPAQAVMEACNLAMTKRIDDWKAERDRSIDFIVKRGRWSWLKFKQVPLTKEEATRISIVIPIITDKIARPMVDRSYEIMQQLLSLAAQAEKLQMGSYVFVSAEDHYLISGALQGVLNNDKYRSAVPNNRPWNE